MMVIRTSCKRTMEGTYVGRHPMGTPLRELGRLEERNPLRSHEVDESLRVVLSGTGRGGVGAGGDDRSGSGGGDDSDVCRSRRGRVSSNDVSVGETEDRDVLRG
jgi:hypothetical protein